MREKYIHRSRYFYGNEISLYGLQRGYVDYATLAKAFDCVLNNTILDATIYGPGFWEVYAGHEIYYENDNGDIIGEGDYWEMLREEREEYQEITIEYYQYYIISARGAEILSELTNETIWYNDKLDLYVWGVTHWGTGWDYVLTDIPVDLGEVKQCK